MSEPRMFEPSTETSPPAYRIPEQPTPPPTGFITTNTPPPVRPPGKPSFWKSTAGSLLIAFGAILIVAGAVGVGLLIRQQRSDDLVVTKTSCVFNGATATVGYTITNRGSSAHDVTLHIEYRDDSGARIDTDTSYVRNVPPGDTVRGEESTLLDAPATSGRCIVTY